MKKDTAKALKELRAKKEDLEKKIQDAAKILFSEASVELFDAYPQLESFGWTQYTPYFNDGDTCTFSSNHEDPYINDEYDWSYTYGSKEIYQGNIKVPNPNYDTKKLKMYKDVQEMLSNFTDDDMLLMFGDHCKVTSSRSGVTVDTYDHE